ncbi:MAG: DEAD/DEAH box helicase, partial [Armatimonadota bacterium]|nr:DEAD/DEAH box helicase [Armatimonadota bacterium]
MRSLRWEAPTPVQLQAVPLLLAGRDVAVQAQTGSGKTAAYGIPVVERVEPGGEPVQALVLVPTRELALQVGEHLRALARGRPIRLACLYGG